MTMLHKQRGSTLLVALVMLMLLTLVALSAMNASTTSIEVVGNAQFREEANAAAQQAIEGVISSSSFTANPASSVVPVNVGGTNYVAAVAVPKCISSMPIPSTSPELDTSNAEDMKCTGGTDQPPQCNKQMWEVNATVNDSDTGASTNVHQGVSVRVDIETVCP